ncbi:MAG: hypothetical protein CK424_07100 [Legionella sp.]|nr:MAG: hypothetical protein CK424_07100 [Legionella sp.]
MSVKKIVLALAASSIWLTSAYAGSEDWKGVFVVRGSDGNEYTIRHTPSNVRFLFMSAGQCMHLSKGSSINGLVMPENIDLCTNLNVDDFTKEMQKLGVIINESIEMGQTYTV